MSYDPEASEEPRVTAPVDRRSFLAATGGAATALSGCLTGDGPAADGDGPYAGESLEVMIWSGNYADRFEENIKPMYEERSGSRLIVQRGWDEILSEIRAAPEDNPPYDVTITEGWFYHVGREDGLFEPIREENVPNLEQAMDYYRDFRSTEFGVPVDGAPTTLIYRDDLGFEPESWADFNSEEAMDSEGVGIDAGFWVFPMHAAAVGMDEAELAGELYDESLHNAAMQTLEEWPIEGWATTGEDIWQLFEAGVIDMAQWYFEQTHFDIQDIDGLSHVAPEENTGFVNHWCVVEGTDKRDHAEHFLNFLLDAETQNEWAQHNPGLFCNSDIEYASDEVEEQLPSNSEEAQNIAFPDWDYLLDHQDEFAQFFQEQQTS